MNDFMEVFVPCMTILSIVFMAFSFVVFTRMLHYKEKIVIANYAAKPHSEMSLGLKVRPTVSQVDLPNVMNTNQTGIEIDSSKYSKTEPLVNKALEYETQIKRLVDQRPTQSSNTELEHIIQQVGDWVTAIQNLAQQIETLQQDPLIQQDIEVIPQMIQRLETQLQENEVDVGQAETIQMLENYHKYQAALSQLDVMAQKAEIQIKSTLSALGTIYSQLLVGQSAHHIADYSSLAVEINEEVHRLQDHLEALQEVKLRQL